MTPPARWCAGAAASSRSNRARTTPVSKCCRRGLDDTGRPYWKTDEIGGRFIACRTGFYDPALFERNREVTFTGRVDGYENRQIGGYDYRFPRLAADVVYLWPQREYVDVVTRPAPWPWWGWW